MKPGTAIDIAFGLLVACLIAIPAYFIITLGQGERRCVDGKVQIKQNDYWVIDQTKSCVEK